MLFFQNTRGSSLAIVAVKHSGLSHKKSTNWTKISMSACKVSCVLHPRELTWYGPGANLSIAQDTVVNFQFMFEVVIFYDAVYVVNCIYCAAILENIMILSSLSSAEVFHDVETTEMHTLTQKQTNTILRLQSLYLQWEVSMSTVHLFIVYFLASKLIIIIYAFWNRYMRDCADTEANMIIYHDFLGSYNSQLHVVEIHYWHHSVMFVSTVICMCLIKKLHFLQAGKQFQTSFNR